jgi:hypothetical protein
MSKLGWVATGVLLTILIVANPLRLQLVDNWVHGLHDHPPADRRQGGRIPAWAKPGQKKVLFYRNPMNPKVTSPVPMKDAMGMDYVPVYQGEAEAASAQGAAVESNHPSSRT